MVSEGKIHAYIMGNTGSFHKLQVRNHQNKSKQVVWLPYGQFSIGWHDMLKSFQEKGMLGLRETSQTEGYDLQCTQHKIQTHYHLPCPTAIKTICTLKRLGIDWCEASSWRTWLWKLKLLQYCEELKGRVSLVGTVSRQRCTRPVNDFSSRTLGCSPSILQLEDR